MISRVCKANIQPIKQNLAWVLALYQRRTDNDREAGSRDALECKGRIPRAICLECDAERKSRVMQPEPQSVLRGPSTRPLSETASHRDWDI